MEMASATRIGNGHVKGHNEYDEMEMTIDAEMRRPIRIQRREGER